MGRVAELGSFGDIKRFVNHAPATILAIELLLPGCAIMPPIYPVARDISGRVLDANTGRPIPTATIAIRETGDSFQSSAAGIFTTGYPRRFWSPPPHPFLTLSASARGYDSAELQIPLSRDHATNSKQTRENIVFRLEPK